MWISLDIEVVLYRLYFSWSGQTSPPDPAACAAEFILPVLFDRIWTLTKIACILHHGNFVFIKLRVQNLTFSADRKWCKVPSCQSLTCFRPPRLRKHNIFYTFYYFPRPDFHTSTLFTSIFDPLFSKLWSIFGFNLFLFLFWWLIPFLTKGWISEFDLFSWQKYFRVNGPLIKHSLFWVLVIISSRCQTSISLNLSLLCRFTKINFNNRNK